MWIWGEADKIGNRLDEEEEERLMQGLIHNENEALLAKWAQPTEMARR